VGEVDYLKDWQMLAARHHNGCNVRENTTGVVGGEAISASSPQGMTWYAKGFASVSCRASV